MTNITLDVASYERRYCRFYVLTYNGRRCVLMSVDKWLKIKEDFYERFCSKEGKNCPLLHKILKQIKAREHSAPRLHK